MTNIKDILQDVNGTSFVGLDTLTPVILRGGKSNPQLGRVKKLVIRSSVCVFSNGRSNGYDNMVRRRLLKEGKNPDTFVLGPRRWGTRLPGIPLIQHDKDGIIKHYVEVIFLNAGEVQYLLDGKPIDKADIQGLVVPQDAEQAGLTDKVILRDYSLDSIIKIRINKQEIAGPFEVL